MARIPTLQPSVNPINPSPAYQSAGAATLDAFGANQAAGLASTGKALMNVSGMVMDQALKQQDEDNVREAKQLDTNYAAALRNLAYGDGTEQNPGFYSKQGQGAVDAYGSVADKVQQLRDQYLQQASNDRVAAKFDAASQERMNVEMENMARHVSQQRIAANTDASNARIYEAQNNLILGAADPKVWDQSTSIIKSEIASQAATQGNGADWIKAQYDKQISDSAAKAVSSAALTNLDTARKILADHRTEMGGVAVAQAQQAIAEAENRARVQAEHNMIMQQKAQEQAATSTMTKYLQDIIAGHPVDLGSVASDPSLAHDPSKIENIIAFTKSYDDLQKAGNKIVTDGNTYSALWKLIHLPDGNSNKLTNPDDINQFVGTGPGKITPDDAIQLRHEVLDANSPNGKIESELKDQFQKVVEQTLSKSNTLLGIADPKGQEQVQKFMTWFLPEYQKQRAAGKSPADLLNPDSKDYLGKGLATLKRSPEQMIQDLGIANPTQDFGVPIPKVNSQAEYDKLPPGSHYIDGSGLPKIKPSAPTGQ